MIESFKHKGLKELFEKGRSTRVAPALLKRAIVRLDAIEAATALPELNQPGFDFHPLKGMKPVRYSIHVNRPWCINITDGAGTVSFMTTRCRAAMAR